MSVPESRIVEVNQAPARPGGEFVLYWMIAARRPRWNFALDRALEWARELGRPLVVLEALRCDHRWSCERFHRFVIDGMADNAAAFAGVAAYLPYVEPVPGAGKGLLAELARRACAVVTDGYPSFFLPAMVASAAARVGVRMEAVDSNGLLPLAAAPRAFERAVDFRRFLQRSLAAHLADVPAETPDFDVPPPTGLPDLAPAAWPPADLAALRAPGGLGALPIDHGVRATAAAGGCRAGERRLARFLARGLERYGERGDVAEDTASGLSPYLHFGHLGAHQVFAALAGRERWSPARLGEVGRGERAGWWGMSPGAEGFLDQLVVWRELGHNVAFHRPDHGEWSSLPDWARRTLEAHARDARPEAYSLAELEAGATADPLWNAAQRELVRDGRIHSYLRMLWGKKILEWSPDPRRALECMIELNNKYALDGRDPNSYSGILWCLGRHDRPWPPERPIFGLVRYMSSANTARKMRVATYLERYAATPGEISPE